MISAARGGPGGTAFSRRSVLRGAVAGAGALAGAWALSGCGGSASAASADTRIQLWHLFSGGDGGIFQQMLTEVQQEDPTVGIDPVVLTWGAPYYTKLVMASVGGRSPDLAAMHLTRVAGWVPGGVLDPWDLDRLADHGVTEDLFAPALWERAVVDGRLWAVPLDFHAFLLFYDRGLADRAGLLGGDGKLVGVDSPDGFVEAGRAMAEVTGYAGVGYGYTGDGAQMSRMLWGLYAQTGAEVVLDPGERAQVDRDAMVEVVSWVQSWMDDTVAIANSDYPSAVANFSTGRVGMCFNGNWELQSFLTAGVDVDAMPMPTVFGSPATYGDSHVFVLPHQADPDPDRREAAYATVAAMLRKSLLWSDGGHIPANREVTASAEYQQKVPQSHYAVAAEQAVFDPQAWFTGSGSDFQARVGEALQGAWLDKSSPEAAVDRLIAALDAALQTKPPA
ncbi:MAG: extracellular solute-binding protein [Micrococcales bacterium]|nr:extracellular solute-binding protein [Micrococcales bacterium]